MLLLMRFEESRAAAIHKEALQEDTHTSQILDAA